MNGMKNLKIYVSHSIRGKHGKDATHKQMIANCQKAIRFGHWLKQSFSGVEWYIPADHDEFVTLAYEKKYLNERQILDVDCTIIRNTCNGVLFYMPDDYLSTGMAIEDGCVVENKISKLQITSNLLSINTGLPELEGYNKIVQFLAEITLCQES